MTKIERLKADAEYCARKCANSPRNRTNPHAYGKAYMMVMNEQLDINDFKATDFAPGDIC